MSKRTYLLATIIFSLNTLGLPSPGDAALFQIATNTLSQLRDLKEIITQTREFNEEFERVHRVVKQKVYHADRITMWMEDLQRTSQVPVSDLDSFNYALSALKNSKRELKNLLRKSLQEKEKAEEKAKASDREAKKSKGRADKYTREIPLATSTKDATINTANTVKDIAIENALLNKKIAELKLEVQKLRATFEQQEKDRVAKELQYRERHGKIAKGVLKKRGTNE